MEKRCLVRIPFPVILLLVSALVSQGCSDLGGEPWLPRSGNGNFVLYVSSQANAIDPVNIKITVDGKLAVQQYFYHGSGHNWIRFEFQLYQGKHTMKVVAVNVTASAETVFGIDSRLYCVVDFWDGSPNHFDLLFSAHSPGFM